MYLFQKVAFPTISRKQIQHPAKDGLHKKIEGPQPLRDLRKAFSTV